LHRRPLHLLHPPPTWKRGEKAGEGGCDGGGRALDQGHEGMDVTPVIPAGRQVLESYGASGFRVSGTFYGGSILVFPDMTLDWPVGGIGEASVERFAPVMAHG